MIRKGLHCDVEGHRMPRMSLPPYQQSDPGLPPFAQYLQGLVRRFRQQYPTKAKFARALGTDASQLSRALSPDGMPFSAERCLDLAVLTEQDPSVVLRLAGKEALAERIQKCYGEPSRLNRDDREVIALLYKLKSIEDGKEVVHAVLAVLRHAVVTGERLATHKKDKKRRQKTQRVANAHAKKRGVVEIVAMHKTTRTRATGIAHRFPAKGRKGRLTSEATEAG